MASKELGRRVAVAAVGVPVVLSLIWLGGWPLGLLAAAGAGIGTAEFYRLARRCGSEPFAPLGIVGAVGVVLWATALPDPVQAASGAALILVVVTLAALGAAVWLRWPEGSPLVSTSITVTGVVYLGVTLSFIPLLRALPGTGPGAVDGDPIAESAFVLLPLLAIWAGDTAAYFAGRAWGRRKLAPAASPGKTVVGALAGLAGSAAAAGIVAWLGLSASSSLRLPVATALAMGVVLGGAGQVGDLAESVLKREAGVKDSGTLLPGHGGVLDRLDALLFALPVTWLLLMSLGVARFPLR